MKNVITLMAVSLIPLAAQASDLPSRKQSAPMPTISSVYDWSGLYAGAHIGAGWNNSNTNSYITSTGAFDKNESDTNQGILGGIQFGYNYQINNYVLGLEGNATLRNINGSSTSYNTNGNQIVDVKKVNDLAEGSILAKVGYSFDSILPYVTAGIGFGSKDIKRTQYATASSSGAAPAFSTTPVFTEANTETLTGLVLGAGFDYAIDKSWSLDTRYSYTKWNDSHNSNPLALSSIYNYVAPGVSNGRDSYTNSNEQSLAIGINYKF